MSIRIARTTGLLLVAAVLLTSGRLWAVYHGLGPSPNEWGLKYDVEVKDKGADKATVEFTLADEGRLKPFYSVELIALSKQTDRQGGRSYDIKAPISLKTTADGKRAGEVQIPRDTLDRAKIRILTLTFDGQRRNSAVYYDIPVAQFINKTPAAAPPLALPPAKKVAR